MNTNYTQYKNFEPLLQVVVIQLPIFAAMMLTDEENRFLQYWERHRGQKKRSFRQLALGLPLGVVIVVLVFASFFSGWFKRADMVVRAEPSLIFVMLGAALLIVVFVAVFSVYHKWDINEQRYRELMSKKNNP